MAKKTSNKKTAKPTEERKNYAYAKVSASEAGKILDRTWTPYAKLPKWAAGFANTGSHGVSYAKPITAGGHKSVTTFKTLASAVRIAKAYHGDTARATKSKAGHVPDGTVFVGDDESQQFMLFRAPRKAKA